MLFSFFSVGESLFPSLYSSRYLGIMLGWGPLSSRFGGKATVLAEMASSQMGWLLLRVICFQVTLVAGYFDYHFWTAEIINTAKSRFW